VAAQVQEALIPGDLVAVAARDDRALVVVHALARDALQPRQGARVPLPPRRARRDGTRQRQGAADLLQRLAYVYLGPDVRFPPMDDPPPGHVLHVSIERIGGVGPWTAD